MKIKLIKEIHVPDYTIPVNSIGEIIHEFHLVLDVEFKDTNGRKQRVLVEKQYVVKS